MRRVRGGDWLAAAGGIVLLGAMFLDWYGAVGTRIPDGGVDYAPLEAGASAWQSFSVLDVVLALLALVAFALVAVQATRDSPSLPVALSVLATLAGALAALLIAYRVLNEPGPDDVVTVESGAWIGLAAALVLAAGGSWSMRDESMPGVALPPVEELPAPAP